MPRLDKKHKNKLIRLIGMRLVEMKLDENEIGFGVDAVSLVESPAIESNFIALKKADLERLNFATVNEEKRLVMGSLLIPDKPILRIDEDGEPYNIFFTKETIRRASQLFLMNGYQNSATLEHAVKLQGVTVVESWIVEDSEMDKTKLYKLDAPSGSWAISMKIDNDEIWENYVKSGKVLGFSLEGFFKPVEEPKQKIKATIIRKI